MYLIKLTITSLHLRHNLMAVNGEYAHALTQLMDLINNVTIDIFPSLVFIAQLLPRRQQAMSELYL